MKKEIYFIIFLQLILIFVLINSSCNLKKKEISIDDFYERYGGVQFEINNNKYISYTTDTVTLRKNSDSYSVYMYCYIIDDKLPQHLNNNAFVIVLTDIKVGNYYLSDTNTVSFQHTFTTDKNNTGFLYVTENNGKYIKGVFTCRMAYTDWTGQFYIHIKNGKFKIYLKN